MAVCDTPRKRYVVADGQNETLDPSSVTDDYWVWTECPREFGTTYGKWLVFRKEGEKLNRLWHTIHPLVRSGNLGATGAKCSTSLRNDTALDDRRGVICVYTTKEMRDEVGLKLVKVVQNTIRYKSEEASRKGMYKSRGHKNTCERTLRWSEGKAFFGQD